MTETFSRFQVTKVNRPGESYNADQCELRTAFVKMLEDDYVAYRGIWKNDQRNNSIRMYQKFFTYYVENQLRISKETEDKTWKAYRNNTSFIADHLPILHDRIKEMWTVMNDPCNFNKIPHIKGKITVVFCLIAFVKSEMRNELLQNLKVNYQQYVKDFGNITSTNSYQKTLDQYNLLKQKLIEFEFNV